MSNLHLKLVKAIFLVWLIQTTSETAQAQYYTGPIARGSGGAGRAAAEASEVTLLNPGILPHAPKFTGAGFYGDGALSAQESQTEYGGSLVDNNPEAIVPGGLAYVQRHRRFHNDSDVDEKYVQFSVGNFVYRHLALGFTALRLEQDIKGGKSFVQWDGVVGLHYNPIPSLGLALVYYHFVKPSSDTPRPLRLDPQLSFGAYYIVMESFRLRWDLSQVQEFNEERKLRWQMGAETHLGPFFTLRFGADTDNLSDQDWLTAGFSFNGPRFHIDYAYAKNQKQTHNAMHSVDLRVPF